jgi:lysyl-tRNA synthetase class 1
LNEKFPVHWLQEIVDEIEKRNGNIITLSTGKTPSGHIHIGILREILICDSLRRIFEKEKKKVKNYLFFDSLDAAKRFPSYIDKDFQKKHLGKPFSLIPCPFEECGCENYAHHFGEELYSTFNDFGIKTQLIWTHELYNKMEMKEKVRIALEKTVKIKKILKEYILPTLDEIKKNQFIEMQKTWLPVMIICDHCNRLLYHRKDGAIIPNRALKYNKDSQTIYYECAACGHKSEMSIYSGKLKLNWRIDWPAKWSLFGTTCEPAGKDHSVKGGAYDTGIRLCKDIFGYEGPVKVPYEWLRLGNYDMKTSKGIVFTPKKYLEIADPEIYRMLILRTNPMKHISLRIEEMPQYYESFERMEKIYYGIEMAESEEERVLLEYLYPLTKIGGVPDEKPEKISFGLLIFLSQVQNILPIEKIYDKAKCIIGNQNLEKKVTMEEFRSLLERTKAWIDEIKKIIENEKDDKTKKEILQKVTLFEIPDKIDKTFLQKLDDQQINGIKLLRDYLIENHNLDADTIQNKIFTIAKDDLKLSPKKLFEAIYLVLFGKKFGPRLGSFIKLLDKNWLLERLDINK